MSQRRPILLFDVMGTVVYDPFFKEVPEFFGMSFEELIAAKHPRSWLEFERGKLTEDEFLPMFFKDGRDYDRSGLKKFWTDAYAYLDGMEAVLQDLADAGYDLHLFSNYTNWYRHIEEHLELSRYASWTAVSCNMGHRKPERASYQWVAHHLGVSIQDCLFVDDRKKNISGAENAGMQGILFQSAEQLRGELKTRQILSR